LQKIAHFNESKTKRYFLSRTWSEKSICTWIMLNPSVADDCIDDNTIKRCIDFSKKWGHGGLQVINLCSDISTDPSKIIIKLKSNYCPDKISMKYITHALNNCNIIYCAWGFGINTPDWLKYKLLNKKVKALKLSKLKTPNHPLYVNQNAKPVIFSLE
tara:strand:+ start:887 stop:1360 length:474 start_codon:yes stop_codon:yes gene_type:complete